MIWNMNLRFMFLRQGADIVPYYDSRFRRNGGYVMKRSLVSKLLAAGMAFAMSVSLTACGGSSAGADTSADESGAETTGDTALEGGSEASGNRSGNGSQPADLFGICLCVVEREYSGHQDSELSVSVYDVI